MLKRPLPHRVANKKISHANRGKSFEQLIEQSNKAYEFQEVALVQKIPNEWIIQRDWKTRAITKAFPSGKSTVDYIGVYQGRGVAFEAKSTVNKTSFPLSNIKPHQIKYLESFAAHKGIAFYLINFSTFDRTFLMSAEQLRKDFLQEDKKSIPLSYFEERCIEIYSAATIPIDYIKGLKEL